MALLTNCLNKHWSENTGKSLVCTRLGQSHETEMVSQYIHSDQNSLTTILRGDWEQNQYHNLVIYYP